MIRKEVGLERQEAGEHSSKMLPVSSSLLNSPGIARVLRMGGTTRSRNGEIERVLKTNLCPGLVKPMALRQLSLMLPRGLYNLCDRQTTVQATWNGLKSGAGCRDRVLKMSATDFETEVGK